MPSCLPCCIHKNLTWQNGCVVFSVNQCLCCAGGNKWVCGRVNAIWVAAGGYSGGLGKRVRRKWRDNQSNFTLQTSVTDLFALFLASSLPVSISNCDKRYGGPVSKTRSGKRWLQILGGTLSQSYVKGQFFSGASHPPRSLPCLSWHGIIQ